MNNQQLYLAWLRTYAPAVYSAAVRRATGQVRNLGGLTSNLVSSAMAPSLSHTFLGDDSLDEIDVSAQYMPTDTSTSYAPVVLSNTIDSSLPGFDPNSVDAPSAVSIDSGSATGLPATSVSAPASSSTFANILTAAASIGAAVIGATAQSNLIKLNTQRAAQGLPPVDASGRVVTAAGTATTSAGLLAFERAITGGGSSGIMGMLPILLLLGVGGWFLTRKRSAT